MSNAFQDIPKDKNSHIETLNKNISHQERNDLYKLCKIPLSIAEKTLPLLPFHQAHRHKELLNNFNGKRIKIAPKSSASAFVVEIADRIMGPRFLPGTLLVIEPKYSLEHEGFVLIHQHHSKKVIFRRYLYEDGEVELETLDDETDAMPLQYQDKIIGVVTEARLDFRF